MKIILFLILVAPDAEMFFLTIYYSWLHANVYKKNIYVLWEENLTSSKENLFSRYFYDFEIDGLKIEKIPEDTIFKDLLNIKGIKKYLLRFFFPTNCKANINKENFMGEINVSTHSPPHGPNILHSNDKYSKFCNFLFSSLKNKDMQEKAILFVKEYLGNNFVGIHIRNGNGEKFYSRNKRLKLSFIGRYIDFLKKNYEMKNKFLCTDSPIVQDMFLSEIENIFIFPKFMRGNREGALHKIEDADTYLKDKIFYEAITELFILSYANEIHLGNYESRFPFPALYLNGYKKLMIIRALIRNAI